MLKCLKKGKTQELPINFNLPPPYKQDHGVSVNINSSDCSDLSNTTNKSSDLNGCGGTREYNHTLASTAVGKRKFNFYRASKSGDKKVKWNSFIHDF